MQALARRVDGLSYPSIANELRGGLGPADYSAEMAAEDVAVSLREVQGWITSDDSKDLARVLELERLDQWERRAQEILDDSRGEEARLDALRAIDRLLRINRRRDSLLALSVEAEVPPSPEADQVDELQARREDRMRERAAHRT